MIIPAKLIEDLKTLAEAHLAKYPLDEGMYIKTGYERGQIVLARKVLIDLGIDFSTRND